MMGLRRKLRHTKSFPRPMALDAKALAVARTTTVAMVVRNQALENPYRLAGLSRSSFVYTQGTSADVLTVELTNGCLPFALIRHLHETETSRTTGLSIRKDLYRCHIAMGPKGLSKLVLTHLVR